MKITPFATEHFYAQYEFTAPHLLSVSDCETVSVAELLEMAGGSMHDLGELRLGYTEPTGHPQLRAAIAAGYAGLGPDDVLVLSSPVEGIYLAMRALLEPGDQVIVLTPAYDALVNVAAYVTGRVQKWELKQTPTGWRLDFDNLDGLLSEKTRMVVVNFPHNPTGFLPSPDDFAALVERVSRAGAWLFCDEMYRGLEFGRVGRLPSAVERYERAIVLAGLSKTHGLPGLRAGWLLVRNEEARRALIDWKYYTSICPAAPSEFLALAALKSGDELLARSKATIGRNLALAEAFFERWSGFFSWRPPQAGSVALAGVDVPSATDYCHNLAREAGVVLLPASCMGYDDHYVRFGFGRTTFAAALAHYEAYLGEDPQRLTDGRR